jgi:hypothetical protein
MKHVKEERKEEKDVINNMGMYTVRTKMGTEYINN